MALDSDIAITRQIEDATYAGDKRIPHIRIEFRVGDHGPFVERINKADFSASKRDEILNRFAREVRTTP